MIQGVKICLSSYLTASFSNNYYVVKFISFFIIFSLIAHINTNNVFFLIIPQIQRILLNLVQSSSLLCLNYFSSLISQTLLFAYTIAHQFNLCMH